MLRTVWPEGLLITQAPCIPDAVQELSDHAETCVLLTLPADDDPLGPLRELTTAAPSAPILVLSDREDAAVGVAAVQAGAQDHLSASELHPAQLARCVRYAIERKRAEVRLTRRALQDPLTGLPNRLLFRDRVSVALDRSQRTGLAPAVMFLDLDSFKQVNDTFGHSTGDRVLHELSDRFTALLRPMDTVARIGGDEFTFLFEGLTGEAEAMAIAHRIAEAAAAPIALGDPGHEVSVAVSIGITMLDDPAISLDEALREADTAMYRAKRLGGGRAELASEEPDQSEHRWPPVAATEGAERESAQIRQEGIGQPRFGDLRQGPPDPGPAAPAGVMLADEDPAGNVTAHDELPGPLIADFGRFPATRGTPPTLATPQTRATPQTGAAPQTGASPQTGATPASGTTPTTPDDAEAELRAALDRGQLRVHYQPRVTISGQTGLIGFEALVRWHHPQHGLLGPADFLELAEESGLIVAIGDWVIEQALDQIRDWRQARPGVSISVNVATLQLADPGFPARLAWAIDRSGGDASVLWLEISADALLDDGLDAGIIAELADLGVNIAIDGVGLGRSSLRDLREFPIDMLKIDRRFLSALGDGQEGAAFIGAVVELGHTLGLSVVAEGVETDHQLARLRDLGCDGAQGFLFSQPVPEESVGEMLGIS
ncbi:MAG TPA: bifunctional diguanylate cyclase/phosphodiesterase [Solirubrobacteraceae bacterium]|jgi:diguanylate cyclase (GGDEF)-like protein